ncbi:MAG: hypothetical protein ACKVXR_03350 [Planctomycetota bacterium]
MSVDLARTEWGKFVFGGVKLEQSPEVKTLISQAAADDRMRAYLECRAVNDPRNTPDFRQFTRMLNAFLQTKPTAAEFMEWATRNAPQYTPQAGSSKTGNANIEGPVGGHAVNNTGSGTVVIGSGKQPAPPALVQAKASLSLRAEALLEVDRGQGLAPRLADLDRRLRAASSFYENEQYGPAEQGFDEVRAVCDEITALVADREGVRTRLEAADESMSTLKASGAPQALGVEFLTLSTLRSDAATAYEKGLFPEAVELLERFLDESPRLASRGASIVELQRRQKQAEKLGAPVAPVPPAESADAESLDEAALELSKQSVPIAKGQSFGCGLLAAEMYLACRDRRLAPNRVTMESLGGDGFSTDLRTEVNSLGRSRSQNDFQVTIAQHACVMRFHEARGSFTTQIARLGVENEYLRGLPRLETGQLPDEEAVLKGVVTATRDSLDKDWGRAVSRAFVAGAQVFEVLWSMESTDAYGVTKYGRGYNYSVEYIRKRCDALIETARAAGFPKDALDDVEFVRAAAQRNQADGEASVDKLLALRKRMQQPF